MPIQIPFLPLDVPPYLLGLDPTLYFGRFHLSKYILQLAKIKKLGKALDKIEQNDIKMCIRDRGRGIYILFALEIMEGGLDYGKWKCADYYRLGSAGA